MRKQRFHIIGVLCSMLILSILLLTACGGGGSVAGGGIGGTGVVASGAVTAKGSIFVNGVEYSTTSAQISINGTDQLDDSGLLPGMAVEVEGEYIVAGATGTAATVKYEDIVKGPVKNLVASGSFVTMEVLGQIVIFEDGNTLLYDSVGNPLPNFSSIANGDVIEVSGLRENFETNGTIRASYAKEENSPSSNTVYRVLGFIESDNLAQFQIAGLTVISGSASSRDGTYVKIEGIRSDYTDPTLTVATVAPKNPGFSVDDKDDAEIEGIVTNFSGDVTSGSMAVNGQATTYNAATIFEGGTADELANGIKIEAEGTLASGSLAADKVQFKDNIKIRANVDTTGANITLEGLAGIVVVADSSTEFETPLTSLNDLFQYDHIEVRGREVAGSGSRTVYAKRVKIRKDAPIDPGNRETQVELQGLVDSFNAASTQIVILGVAINTSNILDDNFTQNDGSYLGETAFFIYLTANPDTVVDMNGNFDDLFINLTWDQAEIEND